MRISSAFPSDYIKASDLEGRKFRVKIATVKMERLGDDEKPILYFVGAKKGMVLNKTNAKKISEVYGEETKDWVGAEIILFEAMVDFKGDTVPAIRVSAEPRTHAAPQSSAAPVRDERGAGIEERFPGDDPRMAMTAGRPTPAQRGEPDDDIPF